MKLTIERKALFRALQHVHNVIETKSTVPALSHVVLSAEGETLSLTATDLDMMIKETVAARIDEDGQATAAGRLFHDVVRSLDEGAEIAIAQDGPDQALTIRAGRSRFSLPSINVADFPSEIGDGDLPHRFSLSAASLRHVVDRTRFAISTEETRYYLNGVYLHIAELDGETCLCAAATDGHRLSRVTLAVPKGAEEIPGVIIPRKTVLEFRRLLDEEEGEVSVALSESIIRLETERTVLTAKLIDGRFPDYERVIPETGDKVMRVAPEVFSQAVSRVGVVSQEHNRGVRLEAENNMLKLAASGPDQGEAQDEIEVEYTADKMEIGYNAQYLLDVTKDAISGTAEFYWTEASAPTVIRDSDDSRVLYVVMPMRV